MERSESSLEVPPTRATSRLLLGVSILWLPLAFLFDGVTVLLLPVRFASDSGAATAVGLLSFAGLLAAMLIQPLAGHASDRVRDSLGRRWFVVLAAIPVLLGLWLFAGPLPLALAALGYVIVQVAASAIQAAHQSLVPEHVETARHGRASSLRTLFDLGGAFLAFALLGALVGWGSLAVAVSAIAVVLGGALALLWLLVPRAPHQPAPVQRPGRPSFPPALLGLAAARFLFLLGTYGVGRFLVLLVAQRSGIDPRAAAGDAGSLLALFTLTTGVVAMPIGRISDRTNRESLMVAGAVMSALGIALMIPSFGTAPLIAGGLLMSIGTAAFVVPNWAAMTALARAPEAGRTLGLANIATGGAGAVAGLLGPIVDFAGFGVVLSMAAAITIAAVVPLFGTARRRSAEVVR